MFAVILKKTKQNKAEMSFTFVRGTIIQIILSLSINVCYEINRICSFRFKKSRHGTNMIFFVSLGSKGPFKLSID